LTLAKVWVPNKILNDIDLYDAQSPLMMLILLSKNFIETCKWNLKCYLMIIVSTTNNYLKLLCREIYAIQIRCLLHRQDENKIFLRRLSAHHNSKNKNKSFLKNSKSSPMVIYHKLRD